MKTSNNPAFDVISLGTCQVDLLGQQIGSSLKEMLSFEKYVGGISPLVAIACAQLGLRTAMVTHIAHDAMGEFIVNTFSQAKIDISQVIYEPHSQTALTFKALPQPNHPELAFAAHQHPLEEKMIDSAFIGQGQLLFISSADLAHEANNRAIRKAIIAATENHTKILLALDNLAQHQVVETVFPLCDIIIGKESDFMQMTGKANAQQALEHTRSVTNALLVLISPQGCFAYPQQIHANWQQASNHPGFNSDNPHHILGVEAFIAGWIYAVIHHLSVEEMAQYAMACQGLAQTRKGTALDFPSIAELQFYLNAHTQAPNKIQSPYFSHLHYASTRLQIQNELMLFSFGHHSQWTKMAEPFAANESRVSHLKDLIATGIAKAQLADSKGASIMVDQEISQQTLDRFSADMGLVVRSVELANQVPLKFNVEHDISRTLQSWPKHHIAKVSLIYHPDDRFSLRQEQEATLALLHQACRATQHAFMIDITPPTNSLITASTIAHVMQRLYEVGIYPDWWQMSAPRDVRSWDSIQRTIDDNDSHCQGVIVQAPLASVDQLAVLFELSTKQQCCKGFSVGRAIYQTLLEQWFSQKIADTILIDHIADNMQKVMQLWQTAKQAISQVQQVETVV